jgi:16S rRNA (uracil1498-N3)-methyltransferase
MTVTLAEGAAAHVGKVLRLRAGDPLVLFDGSGLEFAARIESIDRRAVNVAVDGARDPGTESRLDITLLQGLCRGQRMDMLIQKSTELGVAAIRAISCERSVARVDGARRDRKLEHWRQVAISACEQSGRVTLPLIAGPAPLPATLAALDGDCDARLLLDPGADRNLGDGIDAARSVALLIGPEGGLTDGERAAARESGFVPARIGPRILRTETAPLAAISILQYLAGDFA